MYWTRFYHLCEKIGKKPNTVCRELGLSTAVATQWKNGTIPNGKVICSVADYFGCSVDYLLGRDEPLIIKASEDEWHAILDQMSDESRNQLEDYVDFLLWKQDRDVSASK